MRSMIPRRALAAVIVVWALVTWGGRIGLLSGGEPVSSWVRIVGSLVVALAAGWALWRPGRLTSTIVWVYASVTALVWVTSVFSVWTTAHELAFRLVHTVLAAVSLTVATLAVRAVTRSRSGRPEPTPSPSV